MNYRHKVYKSLRMLRVKVLIIFIYIFFFSFNLFGAENILYNKNEAKISIEEALKKYGLPDRMDKYLWCYDNPQNFCLSLSDNSLVTKIIIFPYVCKAVVGIPFEIKTFIIKANSSIQEIASNVKWKINDENIVLKKEGVFIPMKKGKTEILAVYKDIISNPANIYITDSDKIIQEDEDTKGAQLIMIDVFPYNNVISKHGFIRFLALGVFLNKETKEIFSKEISSNVSWFYLFKGNIEDKLRNEISFHDLGIAKVYCKYKGITSNIQEVKVEDKYSFEEGLIRNIRLVPSVLLANEGYTVYLKALATHATNKVDNVTSRMVWENENETVGKIDSNGKLKLYDEGMLQIRGNIRDIKTSTSKIIVTKEFSDEKYLIENVVRDKHITEPKDINYSIKNLRGSIENSFFLKVEPDTVNLFLGEESEVKVELYHSDSFVKDVTAAVKWEIPHHKFVKIEKNKIIALKKGTDIIRACLEGLDSNPIQVYVNKAKLKTIVLREEENPICKGKTMFIQVEGIYTDGKKKNISNLVEWSIDDNTVLERIGKNRFKAGKKGKVTICCNYQEVKSLPLVLTVYISPIQIFLGAGSTVLMFICSMILLLYLFLKVKINNFNKLKTKDPASFIKVIYGNFKKVVKILGVTYENYFTPLKYSRMIEEKFSINENILWKISSKFSEFEYSNHVVKYEDALDFGHNYNEAMLLLAKKVPNFYLKYILLLFFQHPFLI